jgi:hypothetical protein
VANAVGVTQRLLEENLTERISADLDRLGAETIRNSAKSVAEFPSDRRSVLIGTGSALPARIVTNAELAEKVDTSDEWIVERTGIRSRHIADDSETTSSLATDAARAAMAAAGVTGAISI